MRERPPGEEREWGEVSKCEIYPPTTWFVPRRLANLACTYDMTKQANKVFDDMLGPVGIVMNVLGPQESLGFFWRLNSSSTKRCGQLGQGEPKKIQ